MKFKKALISITVVVMISLVGYWAYKWFAESKDVPGILEASGTIEGNEVMLSSETIGQVTAVKMKEGDLIKKGQLLLTVDDKAQKVQMEQAKAQIDLAEAQMQQASSQNEYKAAVAQKNLAESNVKAVQLSLDKTSIKSPIDGIVVNKLVNEGELVTQGTPVFRIQDNQEMTADVFITEKDLGKVKVGDEVRLYSDSFKDQYTAGNISWIDTRAQFTPKNVHLQDERERLVYKVKVRFDNTKGWFKTGMPVEVKIRLDNNAEWQ